MQQIFVFDNAENKLRIDEYTILLIKEFKDLWDVERNKCAEDKKGTLRIKAFKEFTYIYLMLDYKSPYFTFLEQHKHEAALVDSGLTEADLNDPLFVKAINKYKELLDSDPILSLIKVAHNTLYKMQVFLDNIDFSDVDEYGKPIYKPKDVIADIGSIGKMRKDLQTLEIDYKKGLASGDKKIRGDVELGYDEV